jgi:hypothetical protein
MRTVGWVPETAAAIQSGNNRAVSPVSGATVK